jgi:hypothetical protein
VESAVRCLLTRIDGDEQVYLNGYNRIKILYAPILKLQKGVVSGVMRSVMNENQKSQSHHVTALWCLKFKPGK